MRLPLYSACAIILSAASIVGAAPIAMPLPLWLAANSNTIVVRLGRYVFASLTTTVVITYYSIHNQPPRATVMM
ncbi:hypothetical protein C8Q79DRAFT_1014214 [Trametes meyenii]|nr:hypothetical protein C8Q79DRAFT_1014214 [Trametes meyenii]